MLSKEIPKAILAKNNKFREEVTVVKGVVTDEVNELNRLKKAIEDVIKAIDFKSLNLGELSQISQLFSQLNALINSSSLQTFYTTMQQLTETLAGFNVAPNGDNIITHIENMLSHTAELENLVNIITQSEERIRAAEEAMRRQTQQQNNNNNDNNNPPPNNQQNQYNPNSHYRWNIEPDRNNPELNGLLNSIDQAIMNRIGRIVKVVASTDNDGNIQNARVFGTLGNVRGTLNDEGILEFGNVNMTPFDEKYQRDLDRRADEMDDYIRRIRDAGLETAEIQTLIQNTLSSLDEARGSGEFNARFLDTLNRLRTQVTTTETEANNITRQNVDVIN